MSLYISTYNAHHADRPAQAIFAAIEAVDKKYPEVFNDYSKMKEILSYFSSRGTHQILIGDKNTAHATAAVIIMFEELIAVSLHQTKAVMNMHKLMEMYHSDDHTLISFYRKRTPCSCLDAKHKEVHQKDGLLQQ